MPVVLAASASSSNSSSPSLSSGIGLPCCCSVSPTTSHTHWSALQLEGSIKSAQHLFGRYDMDLDGSLCQQDFYDLLLELNLALPYPDYQRFVDACFAAAGGWGKLALLPLPYKGIGM